MREIGNSGSCVIIKYKKHWFCIIIIVRDNETLWLLKKKDVKKC